MQINIELLSTFLNSTLLEDHGNAGDITTNCILTTDKTIDFKIVAKEELVLSGLPIAEYYFKKYNINYTTKFKDSDIVKKNQRILIGYGPARNILLIERIILNFLQHLSGIASLTKQYVDQVSNSKAKICDTRKTLPGLKMLQKYAVRCGGGYNHRFGLNDGILIKDNHIAMCGDIKAAIKLAKMNAPHYTSIEVECKTLEQVKVALEYDIQTIMLDNMTLDQIIKAVSLIHGKIIEVSGGVKLENVKDIANTNVDYISVGRLTHSAKAIDIGLDIII